MVSSAAKTVDAYVKELSPDRRRAIAKVRALVKQNLPKGFAEGMDFGMIVYHVPLKVFPDTYNGHPLGVVALASQKQYMALYLAVYQDPALERWFRAAYRATGKKLDMGKSCVRFRSLDDLPLDVIADVVRKVTPADVIAWHEAVHGAKKQPRRR
jgi:hypothetical protein